MNDSGPKKPVSNDAAASGAPPVILRAAEESDFDAIQRIYAHHVLHGLASFEEVPPDRADLERRWRDFTGRGLPWLVATDGSSVLGYAYLSPYRPRSGYRFSVEDSIYLRPGQEGRGIGQRLLSSLIESGTALGYRQMIAVIGDSGNRPSIALHERLGFRLVGTLRSIAFKNKRWVDSVLMQRALGEGDATKPVERR